MVMMGAIICTDEQGLLATYNSRKQIKNNRITTGARSITITKTLVMISLDHSVDRNARCSNSVTSRFTAVIPMDLSNILKKESIKIFPDRPSLRKALSYMAPISPSKLAREFMAWHKCCGILISRLFFKFARVSFFRFRTPGRPARPLFFDHRFRPGDTFDHSRERSTSIAHISASTRYFLMIFAALDSMNIPLLD